MARTLLSLCLPIALLGASLVLALSGRSDRRDRPPPTAQAHTTVSVTLPTRTQAAASPPPARTSARPTRIAHPRARRPVRRPLALATLPGPGEVAHRFLDRWLACVYQHLGCAHIPGLLPAYAKVLRPQLASVPATPADLATRTRLDSIRLVFNCPREMVAIATYNVGPQRLQVHPNLVREPAGWQVFSVPELAAQILLPAPLTSGKRPC